MKRKTVRKPARKVARKPTAAQIRARKRFAAASKAGTLKKGVKLFSRAKFKPTKRAAKIAKVVRKRQAARRENPDYGRKEIVKQTQRLSDLLGIRIGVANPYGAWRLHYQNRMPMSPRLSAGEMKIWLHGAIAAALAANKELMK